MLSSSARAVRYCGECHNAPFRPCKRPCCVFTDRLSLSGSRKKYIDELDLDLSDEDEAQAAAAAAAAANGPEGDKPNMVYVVSAADGHQLLANFRRLLP